MATNLTIANNQTRAAALNTAIGASATIKVYTGAAPTNADTAVSGTLLVTLTCNAGGFGTATAGVITMSAVTAGTAVATGTAGWARLANAATTTMLDWTNIGTSGADLNLNSTSVTSGGTVSVTSGTITEAYP